VGRVTLRSAKSTRAEEVQGPQVQSPEVERVTSSMKAITVSLETERSARSRPLSHRASFTVVKGQCCVSGMDWS